VIARPVSSPGLQWRCTFRGTVGRVPARGGRTRSASSVRAYGSPTPVRTRDCAPGELTGPTVEVHVSRNCRPRAPTRRANTVRVDSRIRFANAGSHTVIARPVRSPGPPGSVCPGVRCGRIPKQCAILVDLPGCVDEVCLLKKRQCRSSVLITTASASPVHSHMGGLPSRWHPGCSRGAAPDVSRANGLRTGRGPRG
jgi:hypothetical protein